MMAAWARLLLKKAVAGTVVVVVLVMTALCALRAMTVEQDDDLLAFLPKDNPTVVDFHAMNETFGGTDVALVGIAVDDPFDPAFLSTLNKLTDTLNDEAMVAHALSLANVEDFVSDPEQGGIRAGYLVQPLPKDQKERDALRARVMTKRHIVGNLISRAGDAIVIYVFASPQADPRALADLVREKVDAALPEHTKYWGGAPFISTYIYNITQSDMKRLLPWAVLIIVVIVVLSFRDVVGALLSLLSTGVGIAVAYALMGLNGVKANIVLSSMPVILFAVGSAYAIHVLARYYVLAQDRDRDQALVDTMSQVGPTVLAAGLTTVAGLLSFMAMDIAPLRQFGLYTGLGIFATLVLSLTFVPAVISLIKLKGRDLGEGLLARMLSAFSGYARRQRTAMLVALAALAVAGGLLAGRVEARMENAAFFSKGSPPDLAQDFLRDKFGGSLFIQVQINGDMNDPGVLRELQHFADTVAREEHVSAVTHIGQVLSLVNEAMSGERRLPPERRQVQLLYRFLAGRPAVDQLVDREKKQALLVIKVDSDAHDVVEPLLAKVEQLAVDNAIGGYRLLGREPQADEGAKEKAAAPDAGDSGDSDDAPDSDDDDEDVDGDDTSSDDSDGDDTSGGDKDGADTSSDDKDGADGDKDDASGNDKDGDDTSSGDKDDSDGDKDDAADDDKDGADTSSDDKDDASEDNKDGADTSSDDDDGDDTSGDDDDDDDDDKAAPKLSPEDRQLRNKRLAELAGARVLAYLKNSGQPLTDANVSALLKGVETLSSSEVDPASVSAARGKVTVRVTRYLKSGESMLEDEYKTRAEALAAAVVALGPDPTEVDVNRAVAGVLERAADDELVQDVALSMTTPVEEAWRQEQQRARAAKLLVDAGMTVAAGDEGTRLIAAVGYALMELGNQSALVGSSGAEHGRLSWKVNGVPVLYRGLSRSVTDNQVKSLGLALGLVLVIMVLLFRSPFSGLLAAAPTALTLLMVYGAMGAMGLHLDIGTSMLASIIIGAGVDYAVHLLAAWRAGDEDLEPVARHAAAHAGPAIATNALMVAAGFFVLTLGEARPLQNVGGLTAAAMLVAGVVTFLVISALASSKRYAPWQQDEPAEAAVAAGDGD